MQQMDFREGFPGAAAAVERQATPPVGDAGLPVVDWEARRRELEQTEWAKLERAAADAGVRIGLVGHACVSDPQPCMGLDHLST